MPDRSDKGKIQGKEQDSALRLLDESKTLFVTEQKEALTRAMFDLLAYRLEQNVEHATKLENYFHALHGSAATLGFMALAKSGADYEAYVHRVKKNSSLLDGVFSGLLMGLAEIHKDLERLRQPPLADEKPAGNLDEPIDSEKRDSLNHDEQGIDPNVQSSIPRKKVLLVEDTDFMSHIVLGKLQVMNLAVTSAKDGEEGVRKGQLERPDLMIVDLMLPKMDGFEVCRQIRANPKTKDVKITIMSARKSKDDVLRCYSLGIDDYIVKPFTLDDLEQRIKRLL